ncbi:DUF7373 family lipoprotein [Nocardia aurea]|uniref:Uncharacterized protein n=1 Tax=Nocardia aurea TaxID=2144174 RepID=A0ABV3FYA2_9NOCA
MTQNSALRTLLVFAVSVLTVLASGCGVSGNPTAAPDPSTLDIGLNSDVPLIEPRNDNEGYGRVLESVRMGEAIIDPVEADPALAFGAIHGAVPLPTPFAVSRMLAEPVRAVLERHGMLAGFLVDGTDKETEHRRPVVGSARLLSVILLRFADSTAAQQAAREIDSVDAAVSPENVPVVVSGHPQAVAHWRPAVPTLAATIAHESFVVTVLAGHTTPDLGVLSGLAAKVFDAQLPRLRDFRPTPPGQLLTLPLDQDGMLATLLAEVPGRWPFPTVVVTSFDENAGWNSDVSTSGLVSGPRASYLSGARKERAPVQLAAENGWNGLRRFPDASAARRDFLSEKDAGDPVLRPAAAPTNLPDVRCYEQLDVPPQYPLRFSCSVFYGRYVAIIRGRDLVTTHQMVAAQYSLLVKAG